MTEVKIEKQTPKTITVDVNAESYNKGYDDAYEGCYKTTQPTEKYMGHTGQYWFDSLLNWLPIFIFLLIILAVASKSVKRQKEYMAGYVKRHDDALNKQQQAYEELQKMSALLSEISKKLDR